MQNFDAVMCDANNHAYAAEQERDRLKAELGRTEQLLSRKGELVTELRAENADLREQVKLDRAVCLCGCPEDAHEEGQEDGESCEHEDHECLMVAPAVLDIVENVRSKADRLQALGDEMEKAEDIAALYVAAKAWRAEREGKA